MAYHDLLGLIPEFGENFALLLALALLYSLVGLPLLRRAGHFGEAAAGLLFGGMAILGMRWPIALAAGQSVDGRNLVILAAGAFGGPWVAMVAALAVIADRILVGAPDILGTIAVAAASALLGTALWVRWWRRCASATLRSIGKNLTALPLASGAVGAPAPVPAKDLSGQCAVVSEAERDLQVLGEAWQRRHPGAISRSQPIAEPGSAEIGQPARHAAKQGVGAAIDTTDRDVPELAQRRWWDAGTPSLCEVGKRVGQMRDDMPALRQHRDSRPVDALRRAIQDHQSVGDPACRRYRRPMRGVRADDDEQIRRARRLRRHPVDRIRPRSLPGRVLGAGEA
jgi:hypothetical protein